MIVNKYITIFKLFMDYSLNLNFETGTLLLKQSIGREKLNVETKVLHS